ncbi:transcriptional regulator, LysR family [Paenibacillus curdlanolyticus YK9]|uniref:Transcriptional regulator, LysR family n=1 Tax=Paenibacillus curdlanolyticus YK9 TaxID=717606 RepID=E0I7Y5_9BACL|nr:LysR family transcriptional regulator [Paenibacillus curdlanolyticus]EFM11290.1 transcriptional regulator, LysR family [Paenibacillus curdlanolyticus YK9]
MNIENIEAFVYVIHFNSFNKAADALFLSQPSVTARIQSLERELDAKLFDREGKQFSLTEQGKQFLPFAQQIMQSYKKGKQHLHQRKTADVRELRIGCTVTAANYLLPGVLPQLKQAYPELHVKLITASTDAIIQHLENRELDIGLVRGTTHPLMDSNLFYEDRIRLFVEPGHPFAKQQEVTMEEAALEPFIFFECGSLDWMKIHRLFDSLERPPVIAYEIDNMETAKKLIASGLGIGFLPELSVRSEVEAGKLVPVAIRSLGILTLRTCVLTRKGESVELARQLLDIGRGSSLSKQSIHV